MKIEPQKMPQTFCNRNRQMKKTTAVIVLALCAACVFAQNSWIIIKNHNVFKTEYNYEDQKETVYVYDVSHEDEIILKEYPYSFFHSPDDVEPYHNDTFQWKQAENILFTRDNRHRTDLFMYYIGENAELTQLPGIDVSPYVKYFGLVRISGDRVCIYSDNGRRRLIYDISDMWNPVFVEDIYSEERYSGLYDYFTTLTEEQESILKSKKPLEDYCFILPDGEHLITYRYMPHTADIAPCITTFEQWKENGNQDSPFVTGTWPESFSGMRSSRIFGNTLIVFGQTTSRYTVHEDGLITCLGESDFDLALKEKNLDLLKKLSVQWSGFYTSESCLKVFETGDTELVRAYLQNEHFYDWASENPAYVAARSGYSQYLPIIAELHPEYLNQTYSYERAYSDTQYLMDATSDENIRDLLLQLGTSETVYYGYNFLSDENCFLFASPYDESPVIRLTPDTWMNFFERGYYKGKNGYKEWYLVRIEGDANVWYVNSGYYRPYEDW